MRSDQTELLSRLFKIYCNNVSKEQGFFEYEMLYTDATDMLNFLKHEHKITIDITELVIELGMRITELKKDYMIIRTK